MNKLIFVRLAVGGALAASLGATTALADSGSINTTGPGSTNVVTSSSGNWYNQNTRNNAVVGNYSNQRANTGGVGVNCNTKVDGGGYGSGNAYNTNNGQNTVNISNDGGAMPNNGGGYGGSNNGSLYLTGPYSTNRISSNNTNQFNSSTTNDVSTANYNNQQASSGGVYVTGNTVVTGVGGSGNAGNSNSGTNNVNIENSTPTSTGSGIGGGNSAGIAITGPGSYNSTQFNNSSSTNYKTVNNVAATNSNTQAAQSGPVSISGNTVVEGVGGSGSAYNSNTAENDVGLNN
jgi:hypothetical protein